MRATEFSELNNNVKSIKVKTAAVIPWRFIFCRMSLIACGLFLSADTNLALEIELFDIVVFIDGVEVVAISI